MPGKREIPGAWTLYTTPEGWGVYAEDSRRPVCVSPNEREMRAVVEMHNDLLTCTEAAEARVVELERDNAMLQRAVERLMEAAQSMGCPPSIYPEDGCSRIFELRGRLGRYDEAQEHAMCLACWNEWAKGKEATEKHG